MTTPHKKTLFYLDDVADLQNGGAWKENEYANTGICVVRVTDCQSGTIELNNCKYLPIDSFNKYSKHKLLNNDLVIATVGSHPTQPGSVVGRTSTVPQHASGALLNQNAVRVRAKKDILDQKFLNLFSKTDQFRNYIISHARGAANQVRMSLELLKKMPIELPPLPTQRRIASILSAYDDLIENNTRRIAILEEMARRLYEEWFVNFRFPGHETAHFVETELGPVPEGWEVGTLGAVAKINPESVKLSSAPSSIEYIDISSVSTGNISQVQSMLFVDAPSRARRIVKSTDILWSCVRPNLKAYALIINPMPNTIASTGFAVIRAHNVPYSYIYTLVTSNLFVAYLVNYATGAAYPAVKQSNFEAAKILLPPKGVLNEFHEKTDSMLLLCAELKRKNANLRAQRDLLLPKLISGELDVSEAEDVLEEVAV